MRCHSTLDNHIDSSKAVGTTFDNNGVYKKMFPLLGSSLVFLSVCLFMIFISIYWFSWISCMILEALNLLISVRYGKAHLCVLRVFHNSKSA